MCSGLIVCCWRKSEDENPGLLTSHSRSFSIEDPLSLWTCTLVCAKDQTWINIYNQGMNITNSLVKVIFTFCQVSTWVNCLSGDTLSLLQSVTATPGNRQCAPTSQVCVKCNLAFLSKGWASVNIFIVRQFFGRLWVLLKLINDYLPNRITSNAPINEGG